MNSCIVYLIMLYFIALCQSKSIDIPNSKEVKKMAKKAFEVYKEIDELKDEEENKLLEAFEKSPINHWIESEPEVNPNGSDKDEVNNTDANGTLLKIGWKVTKMLVKKAIDAID
ncbi:uncharacterized protein LOC116348900 [Contarinia nasturtii]|uniref:uncharacterized protein LOC116348900 n=1 Tax=Contarinia nasturtii TaxID=265458 RepID=UPI0012D3DB1E|nr:uncharacterized protein LOC116348900 [Contarinia nasturtii]